MRDGFLDGFNGVAHLNRETVGLRGGRSMADGGQGALVLKPLSDLMSAIIVKAPSKSWGPTSGSIMGPTGSYYGTGQVLAYEGWGDGPPSQRIRFRMDSTGGIGTGGAVHLATALHQDPGFTSTQCAWISPYADIAGIVYTHFAGGSLSTRSFLDQTSAGLEQVGIDNIGMLTQNTAANVLASVIASTDAGYNNIRAYFNAVVAGTTPLYLQAAASQSALAMEAVTSAGVVTSSIGGAGGFYAYNTAGSAIDLYLQASDSPAFTTRALISAGAAGITPLVISLAASQSVNAIQVQDSGAAIVAKVDQNGVLTTKNVAGFIPVSLSASSAAIGSTETSVLSLTLPANSLQVGTTIVGSFSGHATSSATSTVTARMRIGTTTLTGTIPAVVTSTSSTTGTSIAFVYDFMVTIRAIGTSGTAVGSGVLANNGTTGISNAATAVGQVTTPVAVNTTVQNVIEFTFTTTSASATATFDNGYIEVVKP